MTAQSPHVTGIGNEVSTQLPTDTFFNLPEDKRERILSVALEEFAQNPYGRASVSKIAREAEIAKGSVYQYFDSKKELFFYLVSIASQSKLDFINERRDETEWNDFFAGFKDLLLAGTEFQLQNPLHAKLLQHAVESPYFEEIFSEMKQMSADFMQVLLQKALAEEQLRTDVPLDMLLFFMNSLSTEFGQFLAHKAGLRNWTDVVYEENLARVMELDLEQHIEDLVKVLRNGMESRKS